MASSQHTSSDISCDSSLNVPTTTEDSLSSYCSLTDVSTVGVTHLKSPACTPFRSAVRPATSTPVKVLRERKSTPGHSRLHNSIINYKPSLNESFLRYQSRKRVIPANSLDEPDEKKFKQPATPSSINTPRCTFPITDSPNMSFSNNPEFDRFLQTINSKLDEQYQNHQIQFQCFKDEIKSDIKAQHDDITKELQVIKSTLAKREEEWSQIGGRVANLEEGLKTFNPEAQAALMRDIQRLNE